MSFLMHLRHHVDRNSFFNLCLDVAWPKWLRLFSNMRHGPLLAPAGTPGCAPWPLVWPASNSFNLIIGQAMNHDTGNKPTGASLWIHTDGHEDYCQQEILLPEETTTRIPSMHFNKVNLCFFPPTHLKEGQVDVLNTDEYVVSKQCKCSYST